MTAFSLLILFVFATLSGTGHKAADAANLGVTYGRVGTAMPPPPDQAARLLDVYKIGRMRIWYPDHKVLRSLNGSNVQLTVGIPNGKVYSIASDLTEANSWVSSYIAPHVGCVRFRHIVVGHRNVINERSAADVLQAMTNLYIVISSLGLENQIKITTEIGPNVLDKYDFFQSQGSFKSSPYAGNYMEPIVKFLASHDSPLFVVNYPHRLLQAGIAPNGYGAPVSVFLSTIDTYYSAIEKLAGDQKVRLVVGETGWPSSGENGEQDGIANYFSARRYLWDLAEHALSTKGTSKRPGEQIETYVYSLFNGNCEDGFWAHFGLFYPNMSPVYDIPKLQ